MAPEPHLENRAMDDAATKIECTIVINEAQQTEKLQILYDKSEIIIRFKPQHVSTSITPNAHPVVRYLGDGWGIEQIKWEAGGY